MKSSCSRNDIDEINFSLDKFPGSSVMGNFMYQVEYEHVSPIRCPCCHEGALAAAGTSVAAPPVSLLAAGPLVRHQTVTNIFPPTHPPTTFSSLKGGEPQIIFPQNRLPPIFLPQMRKRCTASMSITRKGSQMTQHLFQTSVKRICC